MGITLACCTIPGAPTFPRGSGRRNAQAAARGFRDHFSDAGSWRDAFSPGRWIAVIVKESAFQQTPSELMADGPKLCLYGAMV